MRSILPRYVSRCLDGGRRHSRRRRLGPSRRLRGYCPIARLVGQRKVREARPSKPALTNLLELLWLALGPVETRQVLETGDDIGVIGFEGLPRDTERPTIEKLGLVGTSEAIADDREVIEGICDVGMR